MKVLAVETSCDETAVAVVDHGVEVLSSVVTTQVELHAPFGGVVPEMASRAHLVALQPALAQALRDARCGYDEIDVFAATSGPGLAGALIVGVAAAKSLAMVHRRPFVAVNHHEGHLFAARLADPTLAPPFMTLIVSGGHTMIVEVEQFGAYRVWGRTVDDAAGEAFDKVARYCGLGYPGGPRIDAIASEVGEVTVRLPRPMWHDGYDFSFSGLKTAVVRHHRDHPDTPIPHLVAGFQAAAVDVLCHKLFGAAAGAGVETVVIGGGVAANSALRAEVSARAERLGVHCVVPERQLCTDNAAMIAAAAASQFERLGPSPLDSPVRPGWRLG